MSTDRPLQTAVDGAELSPEQHRMPRGSLAPTSRSTARSCASPEQAPGERSAAGRCDHFRRFGQLRPGDRYIIRPFFGVEHHTPICRGDAASAA